MKSNISDWWKEICICHPPTQFIIANEYRSYTTPRKGNCPGCGKTWDEHILNNKLVNEKHKTELNWLNDRSGTPQRSEEYSG